MSQTKGENGQRTDGSIITVRMPPDLHDRLVEAAYQARTSLNKFCVAALETATAVNVETWEI